MFIILWELKEEWNELGVKKLEIYLKMIEVEEINVMYEIWVKGSLSLGYVKVMVIGICNLEDDGVFYDSEVWINEFCLVGLDEWGGVVVLVRMDI